MTEFGETVTNEAGGSQSRIETRLDLVPASVMYDVGRVLAEGAIKYGEWNWQLIPRDEHIAHALEHINNEMMLSQDGCYTDGEDITHAICRLLFAAHFILKGVTS
jgi:Domain of unknown function (DUF5664)